MAVPSSPGLHGGPWHCAWNCALHNTAGHQGCKVPKCSWGSSPDHAAATQKLKVSVPGQYQQAVMFARYLKGKGKLSLMINREYQLVVPLLLP